jgi:hypothetical protein
MRNIAQTIGILLLAASLSAGAAQILDPKQIPASADLTGLTSVSMSLDIANTYLVKWRGANPTQQVVNMTFEYFAGTSNTTPYPNHGSVLDNAANNQGDLWSDNAIQVSFAKGNLPNSAILIYTNNKDQYQITGDSADKNDPLYGVALRGGVVGGFGASTASPYRISVLPLIWKNVTLQDLTNAFSANVGGTPVPSTSTLTMPTEITSPTGGFCPPEGPYNQPAGNNRVPVNGAGGNGFCDFSTHYVVDMNNNIHLLPGPDQFPNSWYNQYSVTSSTYTNAFNYSSLIGPYGINTSERGTGGLGGASPAYVLLGVQASPALLTHYGTTIFVEVLSR